MRRVTRNGRKARRLIVGDQTFLWSLRHEHETDESGDFANRYRDCRDVVTLRLHGTPGRALVTFRAGEGRLVSDGILPAGTVGAAAGRALNLNEPGTVGPCLTRRSHGAGTPAPRRPSTSTAGNSSTRWPTGVWAGEPQPTLLVGRRVSDRRRVWDWQLVLGRKSSASATATAGATRRDDRCDGDDGEDDEEERASDRCAHRRDLGRGAAVIGWGIEPSRAGRVGCGPNIRRPSRTRRESPGSADSIFFSCVRGMNGPMETHTEIQRNCLASSRSSMPPHDKTPA